MDEMDEKAVVRVDADGNAVKCAKGLAQGCGYKAGAKVCGKCGAMAVEVKGGGYSMDEDEMPRAKRKRMKPMPVDDDMVDDEDMEDDEEKMEEDAAGRIRRKGAGYAGADDEMPKPRRKRMKPRMVANPDEMDEDDTPDPSAEEMDESEEAPDESNGEMGETPIEAMNEDDRMRRMRARRRRMASMNVKSENWADDAFVCGFERKMLPGGSEPCAACPGGCAPEADLPTLIEVEGFAEEMLDGKVLASGYADATDEFIVDVEMKDGRVAEARFDGATGEALGWHVLANELLSEKTAQSPMTIVSMDEAALVATKTLPGDVINIGADVIDGIEVYAVEIDGVDGKSYDGFVTLDGHLYAYDEYEGESVEAKRDYSTEAREDMAEEGEALPDGSYPIANVEDLKNAIQAFGRAKDKAAAKAHIMKRARKLGREDLIPESWTSEKKADLDTDPEFLAALMEFELMATEDDLNS